MNICDILKNKVNNTTEKTIIAIDGRCASGKTTFSHQLSKTLNTSVVHIDDFYLPFDRRDMNKIAGNIDFERIVNEIILPFKNSQTIQYKPYNCHNNTFGKSITIDPNKVLILEGSYSLHPCIFKYINASVFIKISKVKQLFRLFKRENLKSFIRFIKIWIPKEEKYFNKLNIKDNADYILNNFEI